MKLSIPLIRYRYSVRLQRGYVGTIATAKKPLKGETWLRGRDLRDGKWNSFLPMLWDIFCFEFRFGRHSRKNNPTRPCNGSSANQGFETPLVLIATLLCLTSCGPFIDVKHGIVSTGFLSDTDAFSGSIKNKDGSATWSVVNHKGTGVANTGIMAWGAAKAIQGTVDTARSANATTVKTGAQGVQNNAINHTTTLTGADGSQSIATPAIPK